MTTQRDGSRAGHEDSTVSGFSQTDLESLRAELLHAGLDSWQAGELIASFLVARGFGVSAGDARTAATLIESACCSVELMRRELTRLALVM